MHPLFSQDPQALQIISYYDKLELCNPLGTHVKKHKLGILLFTLGNIDPKFRSSLRIIHLAIAATVPVIERHSIDLIMKPYLQNLHTLATGGIVVNVKGIEQTFRGALFAFLVDNLASHALGGFKESFSFSFRICQACLVTNDAFRSCSRSDDCFQRTDLRHQQHCLEITGPIRDHYSKVYGINRRSILMDVPYFSLLEEAFHMT